MNVDVPTGLWLVALAAAAFVTILALVLVLSSTDRAAARRVTAFLLAWLGVDAVLGAVGLFAASPGTYVPIIAAGIVVPIVAGIWLFTRGGTVRRLVDSIPLHRQISVQFYRTAGVIFLIAWLAGRMPGTFALPAGIGDIAVGLAAPFVAARVRSPFHDPERARRAATIWNVLGIADLVMAVTLGFLSSPSFFQLLSHSDPNWLITRMPYVLVPVFAVPLSVLLHLAALQRLRARESSQRPADARSLSAESASAQTVSSADRSSAWVGGRS
ncbi:MAG: hypothetical protein ACREN2_01785 [Candidatus Dormibacteria bacterium]